MKKRRVLALLLTLSLAVSTNSMTVFATEAGELTTPVVLPVEESTEDAQDGIEQADDVDDEQNIDSEDTEKNDEAGGDSAEDQTGKDDDGMNAGEDSDEQSPDEGDAGDEAVSENDLPDEEEPAEEVNKELPEVIKHEVRMMTFTDDTGLRITYDANASQQYIYEIENGVLLSVKTKEEEPDVSGNTIEVLKPVEFKGNVELKQPEEGEKYTSIAGTVFGGNQNITYVKLPAGVTAVAEEAFKGCTGLKGVYLPATVTEIGASAFENCTAMTQISVPKAVTSIGNSAFKGDARLYMVYMKDMDYSALTTIGDSAFEGCSALEAFCSDTQFLLPTSLREIGDHAFYECKHIKSVNLETGALTAMGEYAFADCIGLTDAVMSKTLAVIPKYAFYGCTALASLKFESKSGQWVKIDEHAFEGCYGLTALVLPGTISEVADFAFAGCTNLYRVVVKNDNLTIGKTRAFPVGDTRSTLQFIGEPGSTTYEYCRGKSMVEFIEDTQSAAKKYYKYIVKNSNGVECADGKIPGGQIWIGPTDKTRYEDNINTLKDEKGKEAGVQPDDTKKYRVYLQPDKGYSLVAGSLRANGEVLQAEQGTYYVTMPVGGIVITAEFSQEASEKVSGQKEDDIVVEYSNGEPIDNGVEIKMGQTTRIFLIDKSGTPIGASKIKDIKSSFATVAKVSKNGVVTAAGAGTAIITIVLLGGDGSEITLQRRIRVVEADADVMKLKVTARDSAFDLSGDPDGIQTASIDKDILRTEALTITLKANAYTADKEGIAKTFTWTSSDTKVVKLSRSSTTGGDATNVLEIQKGCEGEATITVTAKNKRSSTSPKDFKETITQKFVVSVRSTTGRLASSSITVNPNLKDGGVLEVLLAYGAGLDPSKTVLYKQSKDSQGKTIYIRSLDFTWELSAESEGKSYRYRVKPAEGTGVGTYKLFVGLNGVTPNADTLLPLTIKVAKAVPTPTVKFNTKKTKFNLFYKNGGVDKDGDPITVTTEITKLGTAKIAECKLEPLSGKEDDKKFEDNFKIIRQGMENGKYTVVIQKENNNLGYTKDKKPVVTGYLALYYEGYEDSAAKKVKVTMPTCTTAPSYALKETKATYRKDGPIQEQTLVLYDKKSKTKEQVKLLAGEDTVTEEQKTLQLFGEPSIQEDGTMLVRFMPESGGKLKLALTNQNWDLDKNGKPRTLTFTYTANVSGANPTVKADKSTVSLNLSAPDESVSFSLIPSQRGVELDSHQVFTQAVYKEGIDNLEVTYENGKGLAKIKEGKTVKTGTYKFECYPESADWPGMKKVTLNVKVVDNKPVVKFGKGTLQLNMMVHKNNADSGVDNVRETASIPFTINGKPAEYTIADVGVDNRSTTITSSAGNMEKHFDFRIKAGDPSEKINDMLEVSLRDNALSAGTYTFTMTQRYVRENRAAISAKPITFKVKVYSSNDITLKVGAKGKINLVNRRGEESEKNGILYTPTLMNIKGEILDAKIFEAGTDGFEESSHFDARLIKDGKNAGKIYVTPKVTAQSEAGSTDVKYEYAELDNNRVYPVRIWVQVDGYAGTPSTKNGVMSQTIQIKTAQVLPKVTTDKSVLDVYLATKEYDASFTVKPKENSVGEIEKIYFGEKDEIAKDSLELIQQPQEDGSMKVIVHLREAVGFANGSTNNIKMYVKYKGQGANTSETATAFTMKIKVN